MLLYHATPIKNLNDILEYGIIPTDIDNSDTPSDVRLITDNGVYGFDNLDMAHELAHCNSWYDYAIVSFNADEVISDPEWDNGSWFVATNSNILVELIGVFNLIEEHRNPLGRFKG